MVAESSPVISEPVISEPVISEPVMISEPVISEPVISEPVISEPVISASWASWCRPGRSFAGPTKKRAPVRWRIAHRRRNEDHLGNAMSDFRVGLIAAQKEVKSTRSSSCREITDCRRRLALTCIAVSTHGELHS